MLSSLSAKRLGLKVGWRGISYGRPLRDELRGLGAIIDPYVYRGPGGKPLPPFLSISGMQTRLKVMRGHLVSGVSAGIIQSRVPEFHAKKFPPVANKVFSDFLKAHREGDLSTLAGVATEDMFASIKAEIKSSKNKGKGRTAYQLLGHTDHTLVLQMRHYVRNKLRMKEGWGQVTCKICTEREIVDVDGNGNILSSARGETGKTFDNITIGVFEVYFGDSSKRWRLALIEEIGGPLPDRAVIPEH